MKKIFILLTLFLMSCSGEIVQQPIKVQQVKLEKPNTASEYADALLLELQATHQNIERKKNVLSILITDYFTKGSILSEVGKNKLRKISTILADFEKSKITIYGYESSSNKNLNQQISDERADKIATIFENNSKIKDTRLYVEGKSADKKIQAEIIIIPTLK